MRYSWDSPWALHVSVQCRDDVLRCETLHCSSWWLTECRKTGLRKRSTSGLKIPKCTYGSVKSLKCKYKILKVPFLFFSVMKVTRKVEEWGAKSYIMVLRFFSRFSQQFKEQKSRFFRLTNVDMGAFCSRLAQVKLTSAALVFMFSNFSHYCAPPVAPPGLCKSCPLFGH